MAGDSFSLHEDTGAQKQPHRIPHAWACPRNKAGLKQDKAGELVPAEIPPRSTAEEEGQCGTQHEDLGIYVPAQLMSFSTKPSVGG